MIKYTSFVPQEDIDIRNTGRYSLMIRNIDMIKYTSFVPQEDIDIKYTS